MTQAAIANPENKSLGKPSTEIIIALQQTLYREMRLLDNEQYSDWVEMLAEDLHYYMPGIETRYRRDKTDQIHDLSRMAYYNDSLEDLKQRLRRLDTGTAWSEDPATRYTHLVSNVEVELTEKAGEYRVYSTFTAFRNSNERDEDCLYGHRTDIWRDAGQGNFILAKRYIRLQQNILLSKNLNIYL